MGSWHQEGKQPPQAVLEIIEGYLHRVAGPTYVGAVSLHIRWALDRTTEMLEVLETRGVCRRMTPDENTAAGIPSDHITWRLTVPVNPSKAWR